MQICKLIADVTELRTFLKTDENRIDTGYFVPGIFLLQIAKIIYDFVTRLRK